MDDTQNPIEQYRARTLEALEGLKTATAVLADKFSSQNAPVNMEMKFSDLNHAVQNPTLRLPRIFNILFIDLPEDPANEDVRRPVQQFIAECEYAESVLHHITKAESLLSLQDIQPLLECLEAVKQLSAQRLHTLGGPIPELALQIDLNRLWLFGLYDERRETMRDAVTALNAGGDEESKQAISNKIWSHLSMATGFKSIIEADTSPAEKRAAFAQKKAEFIAAMNENGYPLEDDAHHTKIFAPILEKLDEAMEICERHIARGFERG